MASYILLANPRGGGERNGLQELLQFSFKFRHLCTPFFFLGRFDGRPLMIESSLSNGSFYSIEGPQGGTPPPPNIWLGLWSYICISWDEVVERRVE